MTSIPTRDRVTEAWREHRPYLVNLAFRMLGDIGEAEDAVQEAFSRLLRSDVAQIDDARGWLIVVTSRLCLDQIRSARWRRQRPEDLGGRDARLPATGPAFADPADRVTLDESVQLALLVVLERLTPAERVVFVLHDLFQLPFDTIAETLGRSAPTCRQLARRARNKVRDAGGPGRLAVMGTEHRQLTERFIAACASGNLDGLLEVLDPRVTGRVDVAARLVISGADRVARNLLVYVGPGATLVSYPAGRQPVLLSFRDRKLIAVLLLAVENDRISTIHAVADPAQLGLLAARVGAGS